MRLEEASDWDAFARALSAREDVLRVAQPHQDGWPATFAQTAWPCAAPVSPFAVYLARGGRFHTVALDLDCGEERAAPQLDALRRVLTAAGIAWAEAVSGPAGHRHLLTTWPEGLDAGAVRAVAVALRDRVAPDLDVTPLTNPKTGCIRPPGSPHRHGGRSEVAGCPRTALRILRAGNSAASFDRLGKLLDATAPVVPDVTRQLAALEKVGGQPRLGRRRRRLSAEMDALRRFGDVGGHRGDRSAVAAAVTLAMVMAGWTFPEFLAAGLNPANRGLDHLRRDKGGASRHRGEVVAAARRMWVGRVRFALCFPATGGPVPREVQLAAAAVEVADPRRWAGQGGPSGRAVLDALLDLAARCRVLEVGRDVRSLALDAGLSRSAAAAAVHRLIRDGWLELVTRGSGRLGSVYRLTVPADLRKAAAARVASRLRTGWTLDPAPLGTHDAAPPPRLLPLVARRADAATHHSLGRHAGYLMDVLLEQPATTAELVHRTGLDPRTVRRHLGRLAAVALVRPVDTGWAADATRLKDAATQLAVTGASARRGQEYAHERAAWAHWVADFHAEHGFATERGLRRIGHRQLSTGTPCPAVPFPRRGDTGRDWRAALGLARAGLGLQHDELGRLDAHGRLTPEPPAPRRHPSATAQRPTARRSRPRASQRPRPATTARRGEQQELFAV